MNSVILSSPLICLFFLLALVCTLLQAFVKKPILLSLFSGIFSVVGLILGFVKGATLQELLIATLILLLCGFLSFWAKGRKK